MRELRRIDSSVNQFSDRFLNRLKSSIIMMKYENTKEEKKTQLLLSQTHQYTFCTSLDRNTCVCERGACSLRTKQSSSANHGRIVCGVRSSLEVYKNISHTLAKNAFKKQRL